MRWYQTKSAQVPPPAPAAGMQSTPTTPVAKPQVPAGDPRQEAFKAWLKGQDPNLFAQLQQDPNLINGPMARKYYQQWSQSNPPGVQAPAPAGNMQSTPQVPGQLGTEQFVAQLRTMNPNLWAQLQQIQGTPQYGQLLQRKFLEHQQGKPIAQLAMGGVSWYRAAGSVDLNTNDKFIDDLDEVKAPGMAVLPPDNKSYNRSKRKRKSYSPNQVPGHGQDPNIR